MSRNCYMVGEYRFASKVQVRQFARRMVAYGDWPDATVYKLAELSDADEILARYWRGSDGRLYATK